MAVLALLTKPAGQSQLCILLLCQREPEKPCEECDNVSCDISFTRIDLINLVSKQMSPSLIIPCVTLLLYVQLKALTFQVTEEPFLSQAYAQLSYLLDPPNMLSRRTVIPAQPGPHSETLPENKPNQTEESKACVPVLLLLPRGRSLSLFGVCIWPCQCLRVLQRSDTEAKVALPA